MAAPFRTAPVQTKMQQLQRWRGTRGARLKTIVGSLAPSEESKLPLRKRNSLSADKIKLENEKNLTELIREHNKMKERAGRRSSDRAKQ